MSGIWLVIGQEFRIRLRTGRWRWLLGLWVLVLAAFTFLVDAGLDTGYGYIDDDTRRGVPLFGFVMYFVLGAMLVISPALTSQSINGDRERGTLATLQVTRLRPAEIAIGKLVAGWSVGLVALLLSAPFAAYALVLGGLDVVRMLAVYAVVALLIGAVVAISQALSALLARSITSALLSYVVTAFLAVGTLIAFGIAAQLAVEERRITNSDGTSYTTHIDRSDKVWWLLAPNPFVVLADAAPRVPPRVSRNGDMILVENYDPLSAISDQVRRLRHPPYLPPENWSYDDGPYMQEREDLPVWPYGLGFSLLLGAGSLVVTTARLRTPVQRLPRAVRVA